MRSSLDGIRQHDRRWRQIPPASREFAEARNRLRALILDYFMDRPASGDLDRHVAFLLGTRIEGGTVGQIVDLSEEWYVLKELDGSQTGARVAKVLHCWLEALAKYDPREVTSFVERAREVLDSAPSLGIRLVRRSDKCFLYPRGARFLDDALVDDVLQWLRPYQKAATAFEGALRLYQTGDTQQHRNLLDNLRVALEQLAKVVLGTRKSLENQKVFLLRWLSDRGLHPQIVNMYERLVAQFCDYQNQAVKHDEEYGPDEIEFMIYLVGTFMRLLIRLADK